MTACTLTFPIPMPETEEAAVTVRSLTKCYRSGKQTTAACRDINFQARAGAITTLLGPNGAGKSSLLKCTAGILQPDSGDICVCGERNPAGIRSLVGYVGEQPALDGALTVAESLLLEQSLHPRQQRPGRQADRTDGQTALRQAVKLTGIEAVLGKKCAGLSKGYAQRVSLALALCFDPAVLILDEFSGGLDPAQIVAIRTALTELAAEKPVIVSTHSISDAVALGGSLVIMKGGSIVCSGSMTEILEKTGKKTLEEAFLLLTA